MNCSLRRLVSVCVLALLPAAAFAQGGANSTLTGVVSDRDGGVIPGATVSARNNATTATSTAITGADGAFVIPALAIGTYTVNVSLQGFKTAVLTDIAVSASVPTNVKVTLEIGGLEQTVTVEGAAQVIQTQTAASSTTLNTNQIINLPLGTRDTLSFVTFLPGVQTPGGTRDSMVNGLPQSTIAITLDGISIQDNYLKTGDGFFARVSPRIDAVEEVTVTTAAQGADSGAQGSTQIKFATRSGSNRFSGSVYEYFQSDKLNSNTFFNDKRGLPTPKIKQNQIGFRAGGPVLVPGLYNGTNKLFYFGNYEELRQPLTVSRSSNLLTADAQAGVFKYTNGPAAGVNLYAFASANGLTATPDPLIAKLLQDIRASVGGGVVEPLSGNFVTERLTFQQPGKSQNRYPTVRMDYNLSSRHRITGSYNRNSLLSMPDTTNNREARFPGFPAITSQVGIRYSWSGNLRSNFGRLVNDLHIGGSGGPTKFNPNNTAALYSGSLANQGGYGITLGAGTTDAWSTSTRTSREATTRVIEDSVNWLAGKHSLSFGAGMTRADVWLLSQSAVPTITLGTATGDPATNFFTATNFPNSSSTDRSNAQALYNLLTGRISSIGGTMRLNSATGEYVYNGGSLAEGRLTEADLFVQDNWRTRPNLSINAGLRYVVQRPFSSKNSAYSTATLDDLWGLSGNAPTCDLKTISPATCNLFKPGVMPGTSPIFKNFGKGTPAYATDWDNLAPSLGVNWTPEFKGVLKSLFGSQGTTSLQGGWSRAYERHGMSDFTDVFGSNPGLTQSGTRSTGNQNLGVVPHLLRDGDLGAPAYCTGSQTPNANGCVLKTPIYPITNVITGSVNVFDPNLQVPYADTWTAGIQRALTKSSAIEVRYVGTRNRQEWSTRNINAPNIIENGFLDEFKLAQANLRAHVAAGCGGSGANACSFAYRGAGTGTSPLPIYLAFLNGKGKALAGDPGQYTGSNWTSSNFINPLATYNSNPFTPAGTSSTTSLFGDAQRRANAALAGLPFNFFFANPDLIGGANVTTNQSYTKYHSLQMQFRRRLSHGLQFDANYVYGQAFESRFFSFRAPRKMLRNAGTDPGDITQALKFTWVYELPFGHGKPLAGNVGSMMDRLVGGWSVNGTARIQSGSLTDLGNVRVSGMTIEEAQQAFKLRKGADGEFYMWPQDIIDNTILAYATSPTTVSGFSGASPSGRYFIRANNLDCIESISNDYGDCGVTSLILQGPLFKNVDISVAKRVPLAGRASAEIHFDILNAFKTPNLSAVTGVGGTTLAGYQITGTNGSSARTVQLQMRFNW